jgi:molybdopterin-binding protein
MIMEDPFLFHTTVFKNITAGLRCRSINKNDWPEITQKALKMVGLQGFEKRQARSLSRGETQRIALARGLALKPKVLLLDEPFPNIDIKNLETIVALIKTINKENNTTIIFTTHDLFQAYRLSKKVISLFEGKIIKSSFENIFEGTVEKTGDTQIIKISPRISVSAVTEKKGKIRIAIPPKDIILSHKPIESSARNSFKGIIKKIYMEGQIVKIDISIDKGIELTALITKTSYENLNLHIESSIFLTFKSTSITVF